MNARRDNRAAGDETGRDRAVRHIARAFEAQIRATMNTFRGRRTAKRLMRMTREALARAERTIERVNRLVPPPRPIACGPGCPYCCHIRLTATPPEILLVAHHLRANSPADRLAALKRKLANLDRVTRGRGEEAREAMRLPCPMLVDNSCSVHRVRPTSCRAVASVDVDACRRAYASRMAEPVPQVALQREAANGIGYGIIAGLCEAGFPVENVEFIAGLRIALEEDDAAERWISGEPIFDPAIGEDADDDP